ncbi:MAG: DUF3836 domain-containing protein [Tannerellaceae bacterium]
MKTKTFTKVLFAFALLFIGTLAMNAATPKNYLYDTKEENGKIISKVIFLQEDGLLSKEVKYEFTYNEAGKVAEKKAYRWDKGNEEWTPFYSISYQYNATTGEISTVYGMWDKKKKDYSLNKQDMVAPSTSYDDIFS